MRKEGRLAVLLLLVLARSRALIPMSPRMGLFSSPNGVDKGFDILGRSGTLVPQGALVGTAKESWKFVWQRFMAELAPQQKGTYARPSYAFDGTIGTKEFPVESGRYHLYLGNPCPWCHRVGLVCAVRNLGPHISSSRLVDDPTKAKRGGWCFSRERPDPVFGASDLFDVYNKLSPNFEGRCTAPLLIDKKTGKAVSNESGDIVKMLNAVDFGAEEGEGSVELRPETLVDEIEAASDWLYRELNNGVYRCGFSTTQVAYDQASADVLSALAKLEAILSASKFIVGDKMTEADIRAIPTLLRFDAAYSVLFRAGGGNKKLRDYPAIDAYVKRVWSVPGVKGTIDLDDAWSSYYRQLFPLNPGGLVPTLPKADELGLGEDVPLMDGTDAFHYR